MSELQTHPKSEFQNVQPIHKTQSIDLHCHLNSTKHLPSCRRARSAKDVGRHPWAWDHRPPARQTGRSPPRRALRWPMKGEKWDRWLVLYWYYITIKSIIGILTDTCHYLPIVPPSGNHLPLKGRSMSEQPVKRPNNWLWSCSMQIQTSKLLECGPLGCVR